MTGDRLVPRTASEAMTTPAVVVSPITDVSRAARLMLEEGVNRLPVVERTNLVGIVTRADLVRAFHRSDDEIEREIREDVLRRILWLDPSQLQISVDGGEVVIAGSVENRSAAELVDAYVRSVPGVVSAVASLTWAIDDLARRTAHSL
jgi:CBS domain-containing protein